MKSLAGLMAYPVTGPKHIPMPRSKSAMYKG